MQKAVPSFLECHSCRNCLADPVLQNGRHTCRCCALGNVEILPPDPLVTTLLTGWLGLAIDLHCSICTEIMVDPLPLACCGHSFCLRCLSALERCPLCRAPLPPIRHRASTEMQSLLSFCFGSETMARERSRAEDEARRQRALLKRAQRYLCSSRWRQLQLGLKLSCRETLQKQWYCEVSALRTQLEAFLTTTNLTSPLSLYEFQIVLRASKYVGKHLCAIGDRLLIPHSAWISEKVVQANGVIGAEQAGHLFVGRVVSELICDDVDADIICRFLEHNAVDAAIISAFQDESAWLAPLAKVEKILALVGRFVTDISEWDLIEN